MLMTFFLLSHVIQLLTYAITIFAKQIPKKKNKKKSQYYFSKSGPNHLLH